MTAPASLALRTPPYFATTGAHRSTRPIAARALLALLTAYPLWWLIGINAFLWVLVAVPALLWLFDRRGSLVAPRGFGLWLLFLAWVALSALRLSEVDRIAAAFYRGTCYAAAAVLLLLVVNLPARQLSTRSLVHALTWLWGWAVGLAVVALIIPEWSITSPVERLLPERVAQIPFVHTLVHPALATLDPLLGTPRPKPLFSYTNNWGSAVALLTPIAIYATVTARTARGRVLLATGLLVSLVPIVASVNRGLWIGVAAGVLYVLARLILRGRFLALLVLTALLAVVSLALALTPLGNLVAERLDAPNTSTRASLYLASVDAAQRSPALGYGAPISSEGLANSNNVSIGTHGQFWTVLVSQGYPGVALFVGFLTLMAWRTRGVADQALWLHAVLVVLLVQLPFYDPLPAGLIIAFLAIALCLRGTDSPGTRLASPRYEGHSRVRA